MSSTLTVTNLTATNITDGAGTTLTFNNVTSGSAKAWGSIDQDSTDHPTYDSFNVSGTVDDNTGNTVVSFTNSMGNADYAIAGAGQADGEDAGFFAVTGKSGAGNDTKMTASAFVTNNRTAQSASRDLRYMAFTIHGDLT